MCCSGNSQLTEKCSKVSVHYNGLNSVRKFPSVTVLKIPLCYCFRSMDNSRISDYDYNLMCTENREFLYENEGIPAGINPDFVYLKSQPEATKMANVDFGETRIVPNQETPSKKRKRNSVKDKQRTEAEQIAYKKLKELIPSLRGNKRITKLQTIREACLYIENLQKTLTGIRKG